jgi:hypothetical protein
MLLPAGLGEDEEWEDVLDVDLDEEQPPPTQRTGDVDAAGLELALQGGAGRSRVVH